jgi:hypothetical protein
MNPTPTGNKKICQSRFLTEEKEFYELIGNFLPMESI